MHILMVAPQPFFRPRGTPFSVLHRIRALSMLGHTVELVTYPFGDTPRLEGLTVHRAARPPFVSDVRIGPSAAKLLLDVPLFRLAARLARTGRFELVHTHEEAGWLGAWLRRHIGLPHLYDMHSSLPQQFSNFGRFNWGPVVALFRRLERATLEGADAVIAICPELEEQVREMGYRGPLAMIENTMDFPPDPIDATRVEELRRTLDLQGGPVVVYTGTLEAYQGLELLIAAAPRVLARLPGVRFLLVGGTQEQIGGLSAAAERGGVAAGFRFVPAVPPEDVPTYLHLADALVTVRARGTNTPLKIYQYLRAERPIVATAIRSHTQVLDEASAELAQPEPSAIGEALLRVLEDPAHARGLAEGAARLARERYGEGVYLERLSAVLASFSPHADSTGPQVPGPKGNA
jgi:glycosyltransferase involved in cell wall biosynthesis